MYRENIVTNLFTKFDRAFWELWRRNIRALSSWSQSNMSNILFILHFVLTGWKYWNKTLIPYDKKSSPFLHVRNCCSPVSHPNLYRPERYSIIRVVLVHHIIILEHLILKRSSPKSFTWFYSAIDIYNGTKTHKKLCGNKWYHLNSCYVS